MGTHPTCIPCSKSSLINTFSSSWLMPSTLLGTLHMRDFITGMVVEVEVALYLNEKKKDKKGENMKIMYMSKKKRKEKKALNTQTLHLSHIKLNLSWSCGCRHQFAAYHGLWKSSYSSCSAEHLLMNELQPVEKGTCPDTFLLCRLPFTFDTTGHRGDSLTRPPQ